MNTITTTMKRVLMLTLTTGALLAGTAGFAHEGNRYKRDRREDVRDRREDYRDHREDRRDARYHGGRRDRREDVCDRREDRRDRREDRYDRKNDHRKYYTKHHHQRKCLK